MVILRACSNTPLEVNCGNIIFQPVVINDSLNFEQFILDKIKQKSLEVIQREKIKGGEVVKIGLKRDIYLLKRNDSNFIIEARNELTIDIEEGNKLLNQILSTFKFINS